MTDIIGANGKDPLADSFSRDSCALVGYFCSRPAAELETALKATGIGNRNALFIKRVIGLPNLPETMRKDAFETLGLEEIETIRLITILLIRDFRSRSADEQKEAIRKLGLDDVNQEYLNRLLWTATDREPFKELNGDITTSPFHFLAEHSLVKLENDKGKNNYNVCPTLYLLEQLIGLRPTARIDQEMDSGNTSFVSSSKRPTGRILTAFSAIFLGLQ